MCRVGVSLVGQFMTSSLVLGLAKIGVSSRGGFLFQICHLYSFGQVAMIFGWEAVFSACSSGNPH